MKQQKQNRKTDADVQNLERRYASNSVSNVSAHNIIPIMGIDNSLGFSFEIFFFRKLNYLSTQSFNVFFFFSILFSILFSFLFFFRSVFLNKNSNSRTMEFGCSFFTLHLKFKYSIWNFNLCKKTRKKEKKKKKKTQTYYILRRISALS